MSTSNSSSTVIELPSKPKKSRNLACNTGQIKNGGRGQLVVEDKYSKVLIDLRLSS